MIYDISGNEITSAYSYTGEELAEAYDIDGNVIFSKDIKLVVMTYNVQDWQGINAQTAMQQAIIDKYKADIIGIQEFCKNGIVPTIASTVFDDYSLKLTNHVNYNAVASKSTINDWVVADYASQDPYDASAWGETRAYMKGHLNVYGKEITIINTHLCVQNAEYRYAQMAELFEMAENEEYCIITGDFNSIATPLDVESEVYINQYKPFVDAGYNLANNSPVSGFTKTYTGATAIESLDDLSTCLDSIIVSSNITIDSVIFDDTKLSYQNGSEIDHIPVVAYLTIN